MFFSSIHQKFTKTKHGNFTAMNCKQFNTISLEEVLLKLGHLPTKQNEKEAWYLNPFSKENQASFKLNKNHNIWFLHSEGIGGNNTDFMKKLLNASVSEVLVWAKEQNFSSFQQQTQILQPKTNYKINEILNIQNPNLKTYLQERGLTSKIYDYIKEIRFTIGDKNLYAIGFENQSGGFELRNSFYKGSLLKKDISIINLNNQNSLNIKNEKTKSIAVFEGFIDALSFIEMQKSFTGDVLVMNSIALLNKTKEHLKNCSDINLFLDNDNAGIKCKNEILKVFPEAKDYSEMYSNFKDLNEFLIQKIKNEATAKSGQQSKQLEELNKIQQKNEEQKSEEVHSFKRKR